MVRNFDLNEYIQHFGEPTIDGIGEILNNTKISDIEKIIAIKGHLRILKEYREKFHQK